MLGHAGEAWGEPLSLPLTVSFQSSQSGIQHTYTEEGGGQGARHGAMSVRDAVEATLMGRDIRLVQRCDVDRIVAALEGHGCYDVPMLIDTLESSFGALQTKLGSSAASSFLALLKAQLGRSQPRTPVPPSRVPSTASTTAPPASTTELPALPAMRADLSALPLEMVVHIMTVLSAADMARAAESCSVCRIALERPFVSPSCGRSSGLERECLAVDLSDFM